MSTILKALRRLEQEKGAQDGRPLKDAVTASSDVRSRRRFPLLALMLAASALGLGLGASVLWLWPLAGAEIQVAQTQPREVVAPAAPPAPAMPAAPVVAAALPVIPEPSPEVSVASPPPPSAAALASPVAVVARPEPPRAAEPEPPIQALPVAQPAKPAAPERGSLPPFARKPPRAAVKPTAPAPVVVPGVLVSSTVWHPQRDRRLARVALEGGAARELHEGDAIGSLVISEIGPSSVVFLHDGVELRRRVGVKN